MQPEISYKIWYGPLIKNIKAALEKTIKENSLPEHIAEKIFKDTLSFVVREGIFITNVNYGNNEIIHYQSKNEGISIELPSKPKSFGEHVVYCQSKENSVAHTGYESKHDLDVSNPPQGGSGVPSK